MKNNEKINNKINYIICDDLGHFNCYGSLNDLCALYAFITYKLLNDEGIDIKCLLKSMCNAYDLYNNLK